MNHEAYSERVLRQAAWQFLTGKAASALLTFAILLWLVRLLPVAEYGAYVVLIAGTEIGYAIASLGLPWLTARFIPDYRLNASGTSLSRLCVRLILWQLLALLCLAALIAMALDAYLEWAGLLSYRTAAWFALILLVFEGLARFEYEGLLAPLIRQWEIRAGTVLRQIVFLSGIAALDFSRQGSLIAVIGIECVAALLGLIVAHLFLQRHLSNIRRQVGESDWQEPDFGSFWRVASRMYLAHLITLASSPQIFLNIIQRTLGTEVSALFGFLNILYQQAARYLPATLLFTLIRPKLMASYISGGMRILADQANLAGKLSLFVLMPLLLVVAFGGDALVTFLSGGKFAYGGTLLLGFLTVLLPFSQRQLIETVAVAAGKAGLCTFGSGMTLLALPLMIGLLSIGIGLWAPVMAMLIGQFVFNATIVFGLTGTGYYPDWMGAFKLGVSALIAWLMASLLIYSEQSRNLTVTLLACIVSGSAYLIAVWIFKPFVANERLRINTLLGYRLFVQ